MVESRGRGQPETMVDPAHRRRAHRLALCLIAALGVCVIPSRPSSAAGSASIGLDFRYSPPPLLASAALVYNLASGKTTYAVNSDAPLPMASTTKLMTALLVLEHGRLDTPATVSYNAASIGQSTMGLYQGEQVSLRDLLYGLLLPSGNDAAITLAEAVGGSEQAFVALMNARCSRLGCTHTHFTSPHGLDAPGHYASARDLLRIALADLHYATFRRIVDTRVYRVAATAHNAAHVLYNVNQPIWWYPGVRGLKSGTTGAAGHCDVLYVQRGGRRFLAVLLGMPDRYTDVRDLLDYALGDFTWHTPATASPIYPPDNFSEDWQGRYLTGYDAQGRAWRYYVGTGYYVRQPMLSYAAYHPELGLPVSEATALGGEDVQQFGHTLLIYHPQSATFTLAPAP